MQRESMMLEYLKNSHNKAYDSTSALRYYIAYLSLYRMSLRASSIRMQHWTGAAPGALAFTARLISSRPELVLPPQTPNSSTAFGGAQQRPSAARPPPQQPPTMSTAVPLPPQTPQMSRVPLQQFPSRSSTRADPVAVSGQQVPLLLTTPATATMLSLQIMLVGYTSSLRNQH